MATENFASITSQVKLDVLPKDPSATNAAKRKEIARTFICELIRIFCSLIAALTWSHIADTVTGWAQVIPVQFLRVPE